MTRNRAFPLFCLVILFLISSVRYIDNADWWIINMLSHFPFQYALASLILLFFCIRKKNFVPAFLSCCLFLFNTVPLIDYGGSIQAAGKTHNSFKVYSANINKNNLDYPKLLDRLSNSNADILLLLEVTEQHIKPLQPLIQSYPYSLVNLNIGASGTGTVLMSVFPILNQKVIKYNEFGNMLIRATLGINDKTVEFFAAHLPRPIFLDALPSRVEQFIDLARQVKEHKGPVIVAGDFNETPYTPIFRQMLRISGLRDTRTGFGWLPSWPTFFPPLWLPIDHILVSPDIQVHKRATGSFLGSDHYPVLAELSTG